MGIRAPISLLLGLGMLTAHALWAPCARAEPSWIERKKKIQQEEREVESYKANETPVVGNPDPKAQISNPFSQISAKDDKPIETFLLFNRAGFTESFSMEYGKLNQADLEGFALSGQFGFGWWAHPKVIVGGSARISGIFNDLFYFVMPSFGLHARLVPMQHWAISAYFGWGISQGLTRVNQAHVPPPPGPQALGVRRGFLGSAQLAYFFWPKRDLALGPSLTYWRGKHDERSFSSIVIGVTYQSGRPNYTGDLTDQ